MDKPRDPEELRKLKRRRNLLIAGGVAVALAMSVYIYSLEPAALAVEKESVWVDSVKRGTMVREVRGPGTLVPEQIRWIAAPREGRVERVLEQAGVTVTPDTVILEMSNPELEQEALDAQLRLREGEAVYITRKATIESELLDQESNLDRMRAEWESARLQADADERLALDKLIPEISLKQSKLRERQLAHSLEIEHRRLEKARQSAEAQIGAEGSRLEQLSALHALRRQQLDNLLKVRAGIAGVLQQVPVEVGQQLTPGTVLARVAQPDTLKAELRIPETQAKDVTIGQKATIDTRSYKVAGRVSRIDPAVQEGYVLVDVQFTEPLPPGARPDLSVDGTVEIERIEQALYVGRPAYGQAGATIQLFKLIEGGDTAVRTDVQLGRTSVNTVEILAGLGEGEKVILTDPSPWDGHDKIRLK